MFTCNNPFSYTAGVPLTNFSWVTFYLLLICLYLALCINVKSKQNKVSATYSTVPVQFSN